MELQVRDATEPGHVQPAADRIDPFVGRQHVESEPDHRVVRRHPGETDTGQLARRAGAAVGTDQVPSSQLICAVRPGDLYRDAVRVLVEGGEGVTPTDIDVVFAGPVRE